VNGERLDQQLELDDVVQIIFLVFVTVGVPSYWILTVEEWQELSSRTGPATVVERLGL
jgi:hypothetical protein